MSTLSGCVVTSPATVQRPQGRCYGDPSVGRARTLAGGLTRVAREAGPRAALAAAVQVTSRWWIKQSRLGLETLEQRADAANVASHQWITAALDSTERRHREAEQRLGEAEHRLHEAEQRCREAELALGRVTEQASTLAHEVEHLAQTTSVLHRDQQGLYDGVRRLSDSLRALARVAGAEIDRGAQPAPSDAAALRISVIIPVRNRGPRLRGCLDSILAQRHDHLEVIVVDDASTDDLLGALAPHLGDDRVQLVQPGRVGDAGARNAGIAVSTGDVIVNFDSDNRMFPGYLERLAEAYAANPASMCAWAAMVWDDGGMHVHVRLDSFEWRRLLAQEVNLDTNCFSYRRGLRDQLGDWDTSLAKHSDWELALRYTRHHEPMLLPAIAAFYDARQTADRISFGRASLPSITRISARYRPNDPRDLKVLIHTYDYPQLSESYIETEIAWMRRRGVEIEVFALTEAGAPGIASVPVHRGDLGEVVDHFNPDLVHCHWLSQMSPAVEAARRRAIPVTLRNHAFDFSPHALSTVDAGVTRSIYQYPHLVDSSEIDGVRVVPVPACFDSHRFYPRRERDRRLVLRASACLPTKDLELFFDVAAAVPQFRFVLALAEIVSYPELRTEFEQLNASLGGPVDLRWNLSHEAMAELTSQAGLYLHTFGFVQPMGMPVSIAEAMACGAVPIVRESPAARSYAGESALYYDTVDDAARLLVMMDGLSDIDFNARSVACTEFAWANYADEVVLPTILDDWSAIVGTGRPVVTARR